MDREDLGLSTWLLIGASIQSVALFIIPRNLVVLLTAFGLLCRILPTIFKIYEIIPNPSINNVRLGNYTVRMPNDNGTMSEKPSEKGVVMFILGARSHHPAGKFAPGFKTTGDYFENMWIDAEQNRKQFGYLGRTPALLATREGEEDTRVWLSYWESLEKLQEWSRREVHQSGLRWFLNNSKSYPHIGIYHETYAAPAGSWESIYWNFKPFGMGATEYLTTNGNQAGKLLNPLIAARGREGKSMFARMGRDA